MAEQNFIAKIYRQMNIFQKNAEMYGRRQFLATAAKLYEIELRLAEIVNSDEPPDIKELSDILKKVTAIINSNENEE